VCIETKNLGVSSLKLFVGRREYGSNAFVGQSSGDLDGEVGRETTSRDVVANKQLVGGPQVIKVGIVKSSHTRGGREGKKTNGGRLWVEERTDWQACTSLVRSLHRPGSTWKWDGDGDRARKKLDWGPVWWSSCASSTYPSIRSPSLAPSYCGMD
jgi:hypothetical protein